MACRSPRKRTTSLLVLKGKVLGVPVYRGYAPLSLLAHLSKADVYDEQTNPTGTQRGLSPQHARDAYDYVKTRSFAIWPEVFLCARDKVAITFKPIPSNRQFGTLAIDLSRVNDPKTIAFSRIDGNHRLHLADGLQPGYPAISKQVSFCLAYDLKLDQEISLFRDINLNQKAMNTSHLDNITVRLTQEAELRRKDPSLFMAKQLAKDPQSPFKGRIYQGGKQYMKCFMPLRSLHTGIQYLLSQRSKITVIPDLDAQYKVIRNYFSAVKKWQPAAWNQTKEYITLRGAGFWGICFIGADVLDKVLAKGRFAVTDMLTVLKSGKEFDWSSNGEFRGLSGRAGARKIRDLVVSEWEDESGLSSKELVSKIMQE